MADCIHCGTWAGLSGSEHEECKRLADEGKTSAEIKAIVNRGADAIVPRPLTARGVFWAVFGALWAFSITAGIIVAIVRAISAPTP